MNNKIQTRRPEYQKEASFIEIYCLKTIYVQPTNDHKIRKVVSKLKKKSAPGHDQVTVLDVINLGNASILILSKLINNSIVGGNFSEELKITRISPIFKTGDRSDCDNYRPISVVSVFSKILEKNIKKGMLNFIENYIKTDDFQYDFINNKCHIGPNK